MAIDKYVAERRRFARLFGIETEFGLPIGVQSEDELEHETTNTTDRPE